MPRLFSGNPPRHKNIKIILGGLHPPAEGGGGGDEKSGSSFQNNSKLVHLQILRDSFCQGNFCTVFLIFVASSCMLPVGNAETI